MADEVFAKPTAFLKPIRRRQKTDEKLAEHQIDIDRGSTGEKLVESTTGEKLVESTTGEKLVESAADIEKKEEADVPQYKEVIPELEYSEPTWSGEASYCYSLEVLKGGKIIEEIDISSSAVQTVGRLPCTDVPCLHPSISRYHAVFQHKSKDANNKGAVFLYDLGSSYGTIVNKVKITPHTYYMLRTGYVIKFGASTRLYIVKGPPEEAFDDEKEMIQDTPATKPTEGTAVTPEGTPSVTEGTAVTPPTGAVCSEEAEQFLTQVREREAQIEGQEDKKKGKPSGISWGFREDAVEEEYMTLDLEKMAKPAEFKDPKKTLRGYFEREGLDLEYSVTESGQGRNHQYICKVELPLDTPGPVIAEGSSCGKKRDAVLACAIHACQLLDGYNVLRSCHVHSVSKSEKLSKNDYYEEEEDTFTDRTGEIERKRKRRMVRAGVEEEKKSKTYDMLCKELEKVDCQMETLSTIISASKVSDVVDGGDELDAYMASVRASTTVDTGSLKESKKKLYDLKLDKVRLQRLCQLAKPIAMPEVKRLSSVPSNICTGKIGSVSSKKHSMTPLVKTVFSPTRSEQQSNPILHPTAAKTSKKIKIEFSKVFSKPMMDVNDCKDSEKQSISIPINEDVTEIPGNFNTEEDIKDDNINEDNIKEDNIKEDNIKEDNINEDNIMEENIKEENIKEENIKETSKEENNDIETNKKEVTKEAITNLKEDTTKEERTDTGINKVGPNSSESATCTKKRKRSRKGPSATLSEEVKWDGGEEDGSEDFINWLPPKNQTGDGRTKLNDKFGY